MQALFILLLALASIASPCWADGKSEKLQKLSEVTGLVDQLRQEMKHSRDIQRAQANAVIEQMLQEMSPSESFKARFQTAYQHFIDAMQPSWSAEEVAKIWIDDYGQHFTEAEIDAMLAYYSSPVGQKDIKYSTDSMHVVQAHFLELVEPIRKAATTRYVEELKAIAVECNCRKTKTSTKQKDAQ